ncbi:MAG: excinuclease ABC subunit A, partial [Comamonas sp.]
AERPVRNYPPVHLPIYVPTPVAPVAAAVEAEAGKNSFTSLLYWEDLAQMCDRSEVRQYMEARLKLCVSSARNQHKAGYFLPGA